MKSIIILIIFAFLVDLTTTDHLSLTDNEIIYYRNKVKSMFYHAYNGYLDHAFDYDELKPITCSGMDTWGSFHLTAIDALDSLILLGNYTEFRRISTYVINNIDFNQNINVSVFETNIRVVGGLLSAHLLSHHSDAQLESGWPCNGPLLRLAEKVARKLLPAFDTPTGMPYGTVNLQHGVPPNETKITCTAGVGTFLVEFGTLSRLTGDPIFEQTAVKAIESLHNHRSSIDLIGNHLNVFTGDWFALDCSIGAGVDSYFEYLIKGTFLFKNPQYLEMFHVYNDAIKRYMKRDDWYFLANMNNGLISQPIFQSLEAFWPGLLTLIGNIDEAKKILLNYNHVWKQYGFMPEFYDILNSNIKREGYPLRPEYVESIFYLYKATRDPFYLKLATEVIDSIETSAKTKCGYATVKDVGTHTIEDRMESFFIAETLKYLYLLFDHQHFIYNSGERGKEITVKMGFKTQQCVIDSGGYIFNTEAHPVDIAAVDCCSSIRDSADYALNDKINVTNEFEKLTKTTSDFIDSFINSMQTLDNQTYQNDNLPDNLMTTCPFHPSLIPCDLCYYDLLTCPKSDFLHTFSLYGQVYPRKRFK